MKVLHDKLDKVMQGLTDIRVQMAEMSTAQKFMVEAHKDRIKVEGDINERISDIEKKFNYATGIAVTAATVVSIFSSFITKKLFG